MDLVEETAGYLDGAGRQASKLLSRNAALAYAAAGYRAQARRTAHFLLGLDLGAAARFDGDGSPVPGRAADRRIPPSILLASTGMVGLPLATETQHCGFFQIMTRP